MGVIAGSLVSIAIFYSVLRPAEIAGTAGFPRSFWVMEFLLSLAMTGGTRFMIRAYGEWRSYAEATDHHDPRPGAAVRRRPGRRDHRPLRHARAQGRRPAGRLPR